jgi:hypothetical protein
LRVNITYSVDLDDVPGEVNRILEECEQLFRAAHGTLDQIIGRDPLSIIQELDTVRKNLAAIDLKLDDSMSILGGYVQAMAVKPEQEQRAIRGDQPEYAEEADEEI